MGGRATGTFELEWDEQPPYDTAAGASIARVTVTKTFSGDIEGTSVTELIKAVTDVPNSAGYVAIERVTGSVHGRAGSFVLQHSGISNRGEGVLSVSVVPDSGTGQLAGIGGEVRIDVDADGGHTYTFDYSLDDAAEPGR